MLLDDLCEPCKECGSDRLCRGRSEWVCEVCAAVAGPAYALNFSDTSYTKVNKYERRYHVNERVAQWNMTGPAPPEHKMRAIEEVYDELYWMPTRRLYKAHVIRLCNAAGYPLMSERWRYIAMHLTGQTMLFASYVTESYVRRVMDRIIERFEQSHRQTMPKSRRGRRSRPRKNICNLNRTFRAALSAAGDERWLADFFSPRTRERARAIENVLSAIFKDIGLPFARVPHVQPMTKFPSAASERERKRRRE